MEAKIFLKQLQKIDKMIVNKEKEILQWKTIAESTTAKMGGERVQSSGSHDKMADAVCKYTSIIDDVKKYRDELVQKRIEVIAAIEQLENPYEYDILHKIYVGEETILEDGTKYTHYCDFQEVADSYGMSYSWATTRHGTALKQVQKILDERKEMQCKKK